MDLYGCYFEYSGISSRQYGLVFANANTERFVSLSGQVRSAAVFSKKGQRNYLIGEMFQDSPIQFDAEIVSEEECGIETYVRRAIEKWLFHQPDYCKLYIDLGCDSLGDSTEIINNKHKRLYLNCRFINPEKIEGNGTLVGYKFTVECDSCLAWQDAVICEYTLDHTSTDTEYNIRIETDTDLIGYIYPRVTIRTGDTGGDITISNNTDNPARLTSFVGLSPNTTVVMHGDGVNYISGDNYLKFSNKNFIRLLDGENDISVLGNVESLTFEFQNRRYL